MWLPCDGDAFVPAVEVKAEPNGGGRSETATVSRWCAGGRQEELVRLPTARLKDLSPVVGDPSATCDDLTSLPDICLPAVLHNLRLRFASDAIYTSIGPVLISVNPHKRLGHLDDFLRYCDDLDRAEDELLPPHVYRIARAAFTALVRTGKSQSILVSGDSGAGKTEACKLVVACLARLAPSGRAGATEAALGGALMLEAREFVEV